VVSATVIRSSWANPTMSDIGTALTQSLAKDGQTAPTANLPMAGFRHTGVAIAAAASDYARASQAQDGSLLFVTISGSTDDAYEGTLPFGTTSFVTGQLITLIWGITNSTTTPTLNINSSADWPILREDGSALEIGDLRETVPSQLLWNDTAWLLLGTAAAGGSGVSSFNSRTGAVTLQAADVTDALGYMPVDLAGDTMGGPLILSGNATTSLMPTTLQQVLALIASIPSVAGVSSFNSRTGAVTLTGTDVTNALTFSPVQSFNSRTGVVTLTSADVTGALTYTPVNKAGDTMTGTLNGTDASFNRYIDTGVAATPGATLAFGTNQTVVWTMSTNVTITSITGIATEGNEGVLIVKSAQLGTITFPSTVKWPDPGTQPSFDAGTQNIAIVYFRRVGSNYMTNADVF
jgi:hypothetical protein